MLGAISSINFNNNKYNNNIAFTGRGWNKAYNACCDISKYDSINNKCIKTNYNNNWNYVKQYTYDQGRERKLTIYN